MGKHHYSLRTTHQWMQNQEEQPLEIENRVFESRVNFQATLSTLVLADSDTVTSRPDMAPPVSLYLKYFVLVL